MSCFVYMTGCMSFIQICGLLFRSCQTSVISTATSGPEGLKILVSFSITLPALAAAAQEASVRQRYTDLSEPMQSASRPAGSARYFPCSIPKTLPPRCSAYPDAKRDSGALVKKNDIPGVGFPAEQVNIIKVNRELRTQLGLAFDILSGSYSVFREEIGPR